MVSLALSKTMVSGQGMIPDTMRVIDIPQIEIIGYKEDRLFRNIPGVAHLVRSGEIRAIQPLSGNDVFRKIPGLNVVDEEGAGLRINIGIRGLDPDRSRNVLVLEDGVPVALNPYGEPELYFTPLIDKMKGVEVLKGSGQLLFGPQTIGGVVNYITDDPPASLTNKAKIRVGQDGFFSGHVSHGNSTDQFGYILSYTHKRADHMGPAEFRINDVGLKLKFQLTDQSIVGVKLGFYDEKSNSTYIGLTQTMYDAGGQDFAKIAPDDYLPVRRYHASITHQLEWNKQTNLRTTAFAYTTTRNWRRQEFGYTASTPNQTGVIWGDTTIENGAIYMRDRTSWRNRQFEVAGIESKITMKHHLFNAKHSLQAGVRGLWEKAEEQFIQGNTADAFGGNMRDNELRKGFAISAYAVNEIRISDHISANVGLRVENFDYERNIRRGRFTINVVPNVVRDTNLITGNNTFAFLPGAGININVNENVSIFAGIHRGFAPPRTKDAITSEGQALDIEKELSTNYELGARMTIESYFFFNPALFYLDFQNQIIPTSQSSGNQNATGLTNGGRTRHIGIEADVQLDIAKTLGSPHSLVLGSVFTVVNSSYAADRFIDDGENQVNIRDNKLPYAPSFIMNNYIGLELENGFGLNVYGHFTGEQFTDELNTTIPSANGLTGLIESRYIVDGTLHYGFKNQKVFLSLSCKNLLNERYIASRRPQGIKVGLPRFVSAGVDVRF
jgi:Fe(3+) dicitrate transport protein